MERKITKRLMTWKKSPTRKPLVLFGARQVGKTYSLLAFGKENYREVVYFNFENNPRLWDIFADDLDTDRIVTALGALSGKNITKGETLIIFDEIQAEPKAVTSLKYFCEENPEYHIAAAGSLLGVATNRVEGSFPVGKIDELTMFPLDFGEFLSALGEDALKEMIAESFFVDKPLSEPLHRKATALYRTYLLVGGMPECVNEYLNKKDFDFVRIKHQNIFNDYTTDMSKYVSKTEAIRNEAVYASIPAQLAKENKKFQYRLLGENARSRVYEDSVRWLIKSGIVLVCYKAKEGKTPVEFYKDILSYKIYMSDVGLLTAKLMMPYNAVLSDINFGGEAKGAITENYVAEQLVANGLNLYYWESNGKGEIDFLLQTDKGVIPIECKSGEHVRSKSLSASYIPKYQPRYSIRISGKNFGFENNIKSVPLYAVWCLSDKMVSPIQEKESST